ncbi:MAG TPA: PAS domain-containing protein [Rhizomicrobium sp.]|jgi:hypothetical protein|nr:PAS domain-containing protein [Rhizomicrobium sp.]
MPKSMLQSVGSRWRALFGGAPAQPISAASAVLRVEHALRAYSPAPGEPEWPSAAFVSDPSAIDNPILEFFRAYWQGKCGGRAMPARADIALGDFAKYLAMVSLFDATPPFADFRFRVIGTRVAQKFNVDDTGRTLRQACVEAGASPARTEQVVATFRAACETHRPVRATIGAGQWHGQYMSDFDALYLPLSDDGTTVNMVLTVIVFNYETFARTGDSGALLRN